MMDREAFQEIDYRQMFGPIAKWVGADRRSPTAFPSSSRARSTSRPRGRPGPVVLALPEDMLVDEADVADAGPLRAVARRPGRRRPRADPRRCSPEPSGRSCVVGGAPLERRGARRAHRAGPRRPAPGRDAAGAARTTSTTRRPSTPAHLGSAPIRGSRSACATPTSCSRSATRLGEIETGGYTFSSVPTPRQALIHVHPGPRRARPRLPARRSRSSPRRPSSRARSRRARPLDASRAGAEGRAAARADYVDNRRSPPRAGRASTWAT